MPGVDEPIDAPGYAKGALAYLCSKGVSRAKPLERKTARTYRGVGPKTLRYLEANGLVVPDKPEPVVMQKSAAQIAAEVLRAERQSGVSLNDRKVTKRIAKRLGLKLVWGFEQHVLEIIDRTNRGDLVKVFSHQSRGKGHPQRCRRFVLPEALP